MNKAHYSIKPTLQLPFESIVKLSHASDFRAYGRTLAIEIQSSAREKSNIPMITTSSNSDLQSQLYLTLSKEAATSGVWEFPANRVWVRAAAKEPLVSDPFCYDSYRAHRFHTPLQQCITHTSLRIVGIERFLRGAGCFHLWIVHFAR